MRFLNSNIIVAAMLAAIGLTACATPSPKYSAENDDALIKSVMADMQARPRPNCDIYGVGEVPESLIRIPPSTPPKASKNGVCRITFSINDEGQVVNGNVDYCSDPVFRLSTWEMMAKWGMAQGTEGQSVCGLKQTITYKLRGY